MTLGPVVALLADVLLLVSATVIDTGVVLLLALVADNSNLTSSVLLVSETTFVTGASVFVSAIGISIPPCFSSLRDLASKFDKTSESPDLSF